MCGIAGIFNTNSEAVEADRIKRMASMLQHRGPDNTSIESRGFVSMAHTRLSLLDLSARANQPFCNERYTLVYNGEIYNFQKLRAELESRHSVQFVSTSDTEVLFYLLIKEGIEKTLRDIEGMFAFGFFDHKLNILYLARDRIGIKPLFYHTDSNGVSFASELKALTSTLDLELDHTRVLHSVFGYLEHSRANSAFNDTYQVEPGSWLEICLGNKITKNVYFSTSQLVDQGYYRELDKMSSSDVLDEFGRLFEQSISKMLVADAPIGAFVSGGIDSSLIATMANQCGKNPNLYTVNVTGCFSELEFARTLADSLGAELNVYDFEPEMFMRDWVVTTWHNDAPVVVNQHAVPFGNITRVASENYDKAVLTGEGADELFLGYPRHVRVRMENALLMPFNIIESLYKKVPGLRERLRYERKGFLSKLQKMDMQYENVSREKSYDEAVSFIKSPHLRTMQKVSLRLIDMTLYSLLWRNDRMGMMNSIESRFPFLDEDILRFAGSLPLKHKIKRTLQFKDIRHPFMIDKYLVRKLASKTLPPILTGKRKQAFPIHGLRNVKVGYEYFEGGFWQEFMKLTNANLHYMYESLTPVQIAKIASVDVWGRLFYNREDIDTVQSDLISHSSFIL